MRHYWLMDATQFALVFALFAVWCVGAVAIVAVASLRIKARSEAIDARLARIEQTLTTARDQAWYWTPEWQAGERELMPILLRAGLCTSTLMKSLRRS